MAEEIYRAAFSAVLHASALENAGTVTSAWLPTALYTEAVALLNVTAVGGTGPKLDVKFQTTDDPVNGAAYDLGSAFAQQSAAGTAALKLTTIGPYVRAVQVISGTTTPTATYVLTLVLKS